MESYGLEMDDLFDDGDISQDLNEFETVADNADERDVEKEESSNTQNEEGDISQQVAEKLKQLGKGAAKKRVLRPQPKLDPARLTGERGIPLLPTLFEKVKYKGKGHEIRDLNKMMGVMEHWGHRLFPKMPFDELIERVERLGQKKAVQTCVNKIRLDMPILDDDFVSQVSDEEGPAATGDNNTQPDQDELRLIMNEVEANHTVLDEDEEALNDILEEERAGSQNVVLSASTPYPKPKPSSQHNSSDLTTDQLERIRLNQEKARQRRLNASSNDSAVLNDAGPSLDTSANNENNKSHANTDSSLSTGEAQADAMDGSSTETSHHGDHNQDSVTAIITDGNSDQSLDIRNSDTVMVGHGNDMMSLSDVEIQQRTASPLSSTNDNESSIASNSLTEDNRPSIGVADEHMDDDTNK